jgi:PDZ domain-containing protein
MIDAMAESQDAASVVAERAAGYRVPQPAQTLVVRSVLGTSHASGVLADGDTLASVDGAPVSRIGDLRRALGIVRVGDTVTVVYRRAGRVASARIETISGPAGPRLGVGLRPRIAKPDLPVPVRYDMGNVAGSSGGLMFALQIYTDLRPTRARDPIAGTGTIALDGTVGKIEGAEQKLIAARRAGVRTFLVPRENYAAVANVAGVRVIPVHTFGEALAAIGE